MKQRETISLGGNVILRQLQVNHFHFISCCYLIVNMLTYLILDKIIIMISPAFSTCTILCTIMWTGVERECVLFVLISVC